MIGSTTRLLRITRYLNPNTPPATHVAGWHAYGRIETLNISFFVDPIRCPLPSVVKLKGRNQVSKM